MADLNILDFYKDTALILMSLQRVFPRKMELFVEDLIGPDQVDEFGLHTKRHEACFGAMLWLSDEGFLKYGATIRQDGIDQAFLTAKGLIRLTTIVEAPWSGREASNTEEEVPRFEARERLTMIEHMRRAVSSQSSEQMTQVMRAFFNEL
ncbi:hypothetical protein [Ketobacter sp.]|uniref:hypothetical protein n=1 Tax=Ketobacter sp. TaxID=2083498 RepID=UPI000F0EB8BD|nr:hypothetical protein [Ketobacter sp.]RLT98077.1 MAG: hypothetical protein D9N14_10655 [Ketobacter sp.]